MGCGQSKINLYPRRNKNGGKGNTAKKSGAADKEADEEEGAGAGAGGALPPEEDDEDQVKHILPLAHPATIEVSASQQDFFKMLDEKIEQGKDYDSSSETEQQKERERRRMLIDEWRSASQCTQSSQSQSQPSPPTPARRRIPRPMPSQDSSSPGSARRYCRHQHVPDGMSPPPRRAHSAQPHHEQHLINGDNWNEPSKSPVKRPQSAGANWKNNPKVAPYNQKPKKNEVNEYQRSHQQDDISPHEISHTNYNPTFQNQSPAHAAKPQPYIAQIVSYPKSQQVTPPSPPTPKLIAPPEEYQDPQNNIVDNKYNVSQNQKQTNPSNSQSNIYYIHGNSSTTVTQDLAQQRQQTAIHLQQYVAMKQAQQQMYNYLQRGPHTVFPNVPMDYSQTSRPEGEDYPQYTHIAMRPLSAPTVGVVRPAHVAGYSPLSEGSHMVQVPMWSHVPQVPQVMPTMGPWVPGQVPQEMQYYPQSQFVPMYRANSAGSAGTLTRYHKKDSMDSEVKINVCQSINLVRQKPIGQIVSLPGQELTVCNNLSDSPSPASISTDSGVSPGNSAPSSKASAASAASAVSAASSTGDACPVAPLDKIKKKKVPFTRSMKSSKSLDS